MAILNVCLILIWVSINGVLPSSSSHHWNHWVLKDGRIQHKIDSPFFMRAPDDLASFLNQIQLNEHVETSYLQLLRQRQSIMDHLSFSVKFGEDLVEQAKCAMEYYVLEKRSSYLIFSPAYIRRLNLALAQTNNVRQTLSKVSHEPICDGSVILDIPNVDSSFKQIYGDLRSLKSGFRQRLVMETAEKMPLSGMAVSTTMDFIRRLAISEMQREQSNTGDLWHAFLLASYYWRMRGQAPQAVDCAQLSIMYAPQQDKDLALLSLGSILLRCGHLNDAEVLLKAAVEHRRDVAENRIVLASTLALKNDFNDSVHHLDEAELLDPSLLPRTQTVRKFISCLDNLTKKTTKMYSYVEYMKEEVKEFKKMKTQITQKHEELMRQQVPINVRYADKIVDNEDLRKRGQYCSTRSSTAPQGGELFCDFFTDIQIRLKSNEVDVDALERDLRLTSEAVLRQVSAEMHKQMDFEKDQKIEMKKDSVTGENK